MGVHPLNTQVLRSVIRAAPTSAWPSESSFPLKNWGFHMKKGYQIQTKVHGVDLFNGVLSLKMRCFFKKKNIWVWLEKTRKNMFISIGVTHICMDLISTAT